MIVYADDIAAAVLAGRAPLSDLVEHFRRDNPFEKSLRQHASFWASCARATKKWPRQTRLKAAVKATACLKAARAVTVTVPLP